MNNVSQNKLYEIFYLTGKKVPIIIYILLFQLYMHGIY
jgi:hypothetical protein